MNKIAVDLSSDGIRAAVYGREIDRLQDLLAAAKTALETCVEGESDRGIGPSFDEGKVAAARAAINCYFGVPGRSAR